jgi:hypothetical protein
LLVTHFSSFLPDKTDPIRWRGKAKENQVEGGKTPTW